MELSSNTLVTTVIIQKYQIWVASSHMPLIDREWKAMGDLLTEHGVLEAWTQHNRMIPHFAFLKWKDKESYHWYIDNCGTAQLPNPMRYISKKLDTGALMGFETEVYPIKEHQYR